MLIGLTGRNAAGKGEVARYLQKKSFYYYSLSDVIRDEIRSRDLQPTRESLIRALYRSQVSDDLSYSRDRSFALTVRDRKVSRFEMRFA